MLSIAYESKLIGGIQELDQNELCMISGGDDRNGTGCAIVGNLVGGTLGAIAGVAVSSFGTPGLGIAAGILIGGMSSASATSACSSAFSKKNHTSK